MDKSTSKSTRNSIIAILIIIAVASLLIRLLTEYEFDRSGLLYIGTPFLIAITLLFIEIPNKKQPWIVTYFNIIKFSLIILLASSVILFEGFICVVMFMPIYFFVILLVLLIDFCRRKLIEKKHRGKTYVQVLPLLLLLSAFEGVLPQLSFEREYEVTLERVIHASVDDIKNKMKQPFDLNKPRHWLLALFPMPYEIDAETLEPGDIHTISFRYHRWFFTNTHEGDMKLEISEVTDSYIKTRFIQDTSYIANYMILRGTEVHFAPIDQNKTHVTLKIKYHRFLDPVWYFGPLQEFAMKHTGGLFFDQIISPDNVLVEEIGEETTAHD